MTWMALPITSAGRFSPLGPRGIVKTGEQIFASNRYKDGLSYHRRDRQGSVPLQRAVRGTAKNTHSLTALAKHVGIAFTEDEGIILDVMSEHIYWAGRYTTPRKAEDWIEVWELQERQRKPSGTLADRDIPSRTISIGTFRQLWGKFANCFHQAHESRYESAEFKWEQKFLKA